MISKIKKYEKNLVINLIYLVNFIIYFLFPVKKCEFYINFRVKKCKI